MKPARATSLDPSGSAGEVSRHAPLIVQDEGRGGVVSAARTAEAMWRLR
jgi:hypothetical protein